MPAPGPYSFLATGFAPATFRRGVPLRRIGRLPNPFPLVQLPYHRLVNPWTLGAVLHVGKRTVKTQGANQAAVGCVGPHRGLLVRATLAGAVRSNALA